MENYVPKGVHEGRCQVEDERFARDNKRIGELEALARTLSETSIKMGEILKRLDEDVRNHGIRLLAIEQKPAKRWDGIIEKLILVAVAAVAGFILSKVGLS